MKKYLIIGLLGLFACTSQSTDEHSHEEGAHEHGHEEEGEAGTSVHILDHQMRVMNIRMGKVSELPLKATVRSNGRLELPPENQADVSALYGGRITRVFVLPGDEVKKGDVLALVEHPKYSELQRDYHRYKAKLAFAEAEMDRKQSLYSDSIAAKRVVEEVQAELSLLEAEVSASYHTLKMVGLSHDEIESTAIEGTVPIKAPIGGSIRSVNVKIGQLVGEDVVIASIVDNDHIHIDLRIYEEDIDKVEVGQEVLFTLRANPDSVHSAKIFSIGQSFEDDPMAVLVHADLDNDHHELRPGMYVDARVVLSKETVLAVPEDALIEEAGVSYVYVREEPREHGEHEDHDHSNEFIFRKIEVSTGIRDMGFVEVVFAEEVGADPTIAVQGAFYLDAELNKSENGHDHHH